MHRVEGFVETQWRAANSGLMYAACSGEGCRWFTDLLTTIGVQIIKHGHGSVVLAKPNSGVTLCSHVLGRFTRTHTHTHPPTHHRG